MASEGLDLGQELPRALHGARLDPGDTPASIAWQVRLLHASGHLEERLQRPVIEAEPDPFSRETQLLARYLRFLSTSLEDGSDRLRPLGRWLRYLLEAGRPGEGIHWLSEVLRDLRHVESWRALGETDVETGPDDRERLIQFARIHLSPAYFWTQTPYDPDRLIVLRSTEPGPTERAVQAPAPETSVIDQSPDGSAAGGDDGPGPADDLETIFARLVEHGRCRYPERDDAILEARIARLRTEFERSSDPTLALELLRRATIDEVYGFLALASDSEFEERVTILR